MRQVILNEIAELQKKYRELYRVTGLTGIAEDYVHMSLGTFVEVFHTYDVTKRDNEEMPYMLSAIHNDVEFVAIVWKGEVEKYGIQIPTEEV